MSADDYRKGALFLGESIELEFSLPDLVGQTEILTEEHRWALQLDHLADECVLTNALDGCLCVAGRNCAVTCRHAPKDTHGRWSSAHRCMVSRWTRYTERCTGWRVPFWSSSRTQTIMCSAVSRPARCTCPIISMARARVCCTSSIRRSKFSIGRARICILSKATRKVCRLGRESKWFFICDLTTN